jgi:hypothetical protein
MTYPLNVNKNTTNMLRLKSGPDEYIGRVEQNKYRPSETLNG